MNSAWNGSVSQCTPCAAASRTSLSSTSADSTAAGAPSPRSVPFTARHREKRRRASARSCVATSSVVPCRGERLEHVEQLGGGRLVDAAQRFVEQHHRRLLRQRPGDVGPLQLATRELGERSTAPCRPG